MKRKINIFKCIKSINPWLHEGDNETSIVDPDCLALSSKNVIVDTGQLKTRSYAGAGKSALISSTILTKTRDSEQC